MGNIITRGDFMKCKICNKELIANQKKYCSTKCQHESMRNRESLQCEYCHKTLFRSPSYRRSNKHFCDNECRLKYNRGNNHPRANRVVTNCVVCNKELCVPVSRFIAGRGKTCGKECMYKHLSGKFKGTDNPYYKPGINGYRGSNWSEQRKLALDRDSYTCQICESKDMLHVHHVKPFNEFEDHLVANQLENLLTVCCSCHSKIEKRIPTNKSTPR